jgi:hypothetical protein
MKKDICLCIPITNSNEALIRDIEDIIIDLKRRYPDKIVIHYAVKCYDYFIIYNTTNIITFSLYANPNGISDKYDIINVENILKIHDLIIQYYYNVIDLPVLTSIGIRLKKLIDKFKEDHELRKKLHDNNTDTNILFTQKFEELLSATSKAVFNNKKENNKMEENTLTPQDYLVSLILMLNTPIYKQRNNEDINHCIKKVLDAIENGAVLNYEKVKD